jgi:hypothetical protein
MKKQFRKIQFLSVKLTCFIWINYFHKIKNKLKPNGPWVHQNCTEPKQ